MIIYYLAHGVCLPPFRRPGTSTYDSYRGKKVSGGNLRGKTQSWKARFWTRITYSAIR